MFVKPGNRNIGDARWIELRQSRSAWFEQFGGLVFEESLIGSYLASLPGVIDSAEILQALPPDPTKFVIVPHADERPTRPRILQIGIVKVVSIDGAIIADVGGNVKIGNLFAVLVADDVAQTPVVHSLGTILRVPDDFIDKVAQMEHEFQSLVFLGPLVFENHSPIGILCSLIGILAGHKGKPHRPRVLICRSHNGSPNPTSVTVFIREAIPVRASRLQSSGQHPASPVRGFRDRSLCRGADMVERFVFCDLDLDSIRGVTIWWAPRPQKNAVTVRIARCNPLRIEIATFVPRNSGATPRGISPSCSGSESDCCLKERSSADRGHEFVLNLAE